MIGGGEGGVKDFLTSDDFASERRDPKVGSDEGVAFN